VLKPLSLFDRFEIFAQGGIDTRDVSYLVLFTATFLGFTFFALDARRWRGSDVTASARFGSGRFWCSTWCCSWRASCLQVVAERTNRRVDLTTDA
jgi:hypothetical protein